MSLSILHFLIFLFLNIGKKITDFTGIAPVPTGDNAEQIDEAYGINVQFEESSSEDDEDAYGEVREDDDKEADVDEDRGDTMDVEDSSNVHSARETKKNAPILATNVIFYLLYT